MTEITSPNKSGNLSRRQSQSAPALLALDRLITSTLSLSQRVSALGDSVRASRSSFSLPNSPAREMSPTEATKQRTYHACHPCFYAFGDTNRLEQMSFATLG